MLDNRNKNNLIFIIIIMCGAQPDVDLGLLKLAGRSSVTGVHKVSGLPDDGILSSLVLKLLPCKIRMYPVP